MHVPLCLALALGCSRSVWAGVVPPSTTRPAEQERAPADTRHLFSRPDLAVPEAPAAHQLTLGSHPNPDVLNSPVRARVQAHQVQQQKQQQKEQQKKPKIQLSRRRRWWFGPRSTHNDDVHAPSPSIGDVVTNTVYSGVYPVVNVTWGNKAGAANAAGQTFVSYVDTGSADTFAVASTFRCVGMEGPSPGGEDRAGSATVTTTTTTTYSQADCNFGALYDLNQGNFTNLTARAFSISYFPEMESLQGSMGLAPITVGGLTVAQQQVALIEAARWTGDGVAAGLVGLSYPAMTSVEDRNTGLPATPYNPFFTSLAQQGIDGQDANASAVFTLAVDRVPRGTPSWKPAGMLALGGLVPSTYYEGHFTSVPIEPPAMLPKTSSFRAFYATTVQVVYGPPAYNMATSDMSPGPSALDSANLTSSPSFQAVMDSGTSANFVPTTAAAAINALFDPPAVFNKTLNYYVVDCDAKPPLVAYRIGAQAAAGTNSSASAGRLMPIDARDMIVRSLNGLPGYENVCFSSVADGGQPYGGELIIGSTWQRGYVVAYDQGRSMMHIAKRKPY
ncbi:Peptidase aspartic [Niveomyces insectorum RCEF 264]|uniref:Peptidase aspartic n=1 Tax=Niveomyces insectorum RCEF 264 TaxID=1081102 RepID=A0A167QU68_9HYPO|nr:Peptidase aspartic [Niveomyces insectorum RCEF 264]